METLTAHSVPDWGLILINIFWLLLLVSNGRYARKHGIWDGAFNQFLPDVKRAMNEYRPNSAVKSVAGAIREDNDSAA